MSLSKYQEKRNFSKTKEPGPNKKTKGKKLSFVVQRHHASHLHYDFRLEIDGVLKSWAVPKGPSLNPKDKRLAMMVEDHPYDYKDFEGEIPKGNYGAGTVHIFDKGYFQSLARYRKDDEKELLKGLQQGSLKFRLFGKKLQGEFALVKIKGNEQNAWLLIKHNDDFAQQTKYDIEKLIPAEVKKLGKDFKKASKKATQPKQKVVQETPAYQPMLAKLSDHIFDDKDWVFERKLDGYRILAHVGKQVDLMTRNGKNYTENYAEIAQDLELIKEEAVIDGEIVVLDDNQRDNFQKLQYFESGNNSKNIRYFVFDLLALNGNDLTALSLLQRKELLKALISKYKFKYVNYLPHTAAKGKEAFDKAKAEKWEGIIAKRSDDEYYVGKRSGSWLKFKINNTQEAIICGYTKPAGERKFFGALVLGIYQGNELRYAGNCGTGFNDKLLEELFKLMQPLESKKKPFADKANKEKEVTWLSPELVCEVSYTEWTEDQHLRHPVFKGLRKDKSAKEIVPEVISENDDTAQYKEDELKVFGKKKVKLTNQNKIFWEEENITKGDVLKYYEDIADEILPYIKNKPLSLHRHPNGIHKPGFFQKDINVDQVPDWIKTTSIYSESTDKNIDYLICNDTATLLYMANLGCIEINPWLSNYQKPDHPDFVVIDLDPGNNSFSEVVKVALEVKWVYDSMGIKSYIKTSGSTGLHIYIYTGTLYDYAFIKTFAEFIANMVHERIPEITSLERSPSKRKNKIYIDYLQNRRGQTIAAPYSLRPKKGATVSYPIKWENVTDKLEISDYRLDNVKELIKKHENPWKDILSEKQNLKNALKKMKNSHT